MAFSTQRDFFHIPFMNESVENSSCKACVKLKSYNSTIDDRAWAMDDRAKSKFFSDLVTCEPVAEGASSDNRATSSTSFSPAQKKKNTETAISHTDPNNGNTLFGNTNKQLAGYPKNNEFQKNLNMSEQYLNTDKKEHKEIKEMPTTKLDRNIAKDFFNKIQQLRLPKNEENELLQMHKKIEDLVKAYEALETEKNYSKRLKETSTRPLMNEVSTSSEISSDEKLEQSSQEEMSSIIRFRDNDDDNIRAIIKERNNLRKKNKSFEALAKKVDALQKNEQHLKADLDDKCKHISSMESEIQEMQKSYEDQLHKARFSDDCLKGHLEEMKEELIQAKREAQKVEMLRMELSYLRNEILKRDMALANYDCQYKQLMRVVDELQSCCTRERTADTDDLTFFTQATLKHIRKELRRRSHATSHMHKTQVITALPIDARRRQLKLEKPLIQAAPPTDASRSLSKLEDLGIDEASTAPDIAIDDFIFSSQSTLDHSRKEMKNEDSQDKVLRFREPREELLPTDAGRTQSQIKYYGKEEAKATHIPLRSAPTELEDYGIEEPKAVNNEDLEIDDQRAADIANDVLCADALNRIKKLEELNNRLKKDLDDAKAENDRLQKNLKDCNTKMEQMLDKLNKLEDELKENAKDAKEIGKDLKTTKDLVKDISDMQIKNQQVTSALKAIKSQDDEKLIDDLRKKLEDALNQLKKCQQDNDKLQKDLEEKEKQLKDLNDLNNKLKAEKDKLLTDMEKLKEERDKLAADKAKLESERNKLADDMERLKKELDKLLDDKKKLEDEKNKLAADLKKMEEERNNLLNDIKKLEDEKNKLAADLKKMEEEKNNLLNNIKKLEDENNKLAADLKKMEEERNNLLNDIKKLEDEKAKLTSGIKQLEDETDKLVANLIKIDERNNYFLKDKTQLESVMDKRIVDVAKVDDEIDNLLIDQNKLNNEKNKCPNNLETFKNERNNLLNDNKKLEDENNKLVSDLKTLENERNNILKDKIKLEYEKNKLESDLKKLDDNLKKLVYERNNLLNDKKKLESEKDKLSSALEKLENEKHKLVVDIVNMEAEITPLLDDKRKSTYEKENLVAGLKTLEAEVDKLIFYMKKLRDEKNQLASDIKKLTYTKNETFAVMNSLVDEKNKLETEMAKLKEDRDKLISNNHKLLEYLYNIDTECAIEETPECE